ncbi:hypothetical protein [Xanthomonas theicola]|uniref:hypothetical protein n=1 Tax=Xanthomonas theicola TaxID=56464 RepID=UPI001FE5624F|nr:hypothetical protein [Xanthomonas theicola]
MTTITSLPRTLLSLSLALAATAHAQTAPRFSILDAGVPGQSKVYDGLIVTYRDGSSERRDTAAAAAKLGTIMAAPSTTNAWPRGYRQSAPALRRARRLGTDADLVRPSRALSQTQLETLMASLKADPSVAHVEPNVMLKPIRSATPATVNAVGAVAAPNDPGFAVQWRLRAPDGHLETLAPEPTGYANRGGIDLLPAWQ